jgi:hypothetical protein
MASFLSRAGSASPLTARLYFASGVGPSGEGDNTIVVFDRDGPLRPRRLVSDAELSPLDLTIAPNGHIVVASEFPFGAPDAVPSVREYDAATGQLVRVFAPDPHSSSGGRGD